MKKLAVISSGGDCPGMNPAIFGIYTACKKHNVKLIGIIGGYDGLLDETFVEIDFNFIEGKINNGGSMIKCGRSKRFSKASNVQKAVKILHKNGIDSLIVIGGDGSTRGAIDLKNQGVQVNCLPGTIDNDLNFAYTLGFTTALNNIVYAVDNILDSTASFNYGALVKIMGRTCSDLIDNSALALYTPFVIKSANFDLNSLVKQVKKAFKEKNLPPLVLVLEDVVDITALAQTLQEKTNFNWRPHILGYIQRGGKPSAFDRKYGYTAGEMAVESLLAGKSGYMIGMDSEGLTCKTLENSFKQ